MLPAIPTPSSRQMFSIYFLEKQPETSRLLLPSFSPTVEDKSSPTLVCSALRVCEKHVLFAEDVIYVIHIFSGSHFMEYMEHYCHVMFSCITVQ